MKFVLAGGGTGGHVIPALAIANELRNLGHECAFVGTARGLESRLVPRAGYPLHLVNVGAFNRVSLATRLHTAVTLPLAVLDAARFLRRFGAQAVIGVGGYAAAPATMAAVLQRIPILLFEPNVVPGFVNRLIARFAANAAVHFAQTGHYFPHSAVTGVPVRPEFFQPCPRRTPAPSLLLFGGSQGSHALNERLREAAPKLLARLPNLRIVHQTGNRECMATTEHYKKLGLEIEVAAFLDDMPQRFADADLIVCRSGASTVAEIAAAGKCAIFVPLPTAADDHQRRNAELLAAANAARLIPQHELTAGRFVEEVSELLTAPAQLAEIAARARTLAHPDAARHIAAMAVELASRQ